MIPKITSLASLGSILLLCFFINGCAGNAPVQHFLREDITLDFVKRVAVLPLQNNTKEQYAAELARDVITTQVLSMGLFDVVDNGIVNSVMLEEGLKPETPLSLITLKRIGKRLNVQAIFFGSVDVFGDQRQGSIIFPEMALTLNLVETTSAVVLWQASGHKDGNSLLSRLFGLKPSNSFQIAQNLTHDLLSTIPTPQGEEQVLIETEQVTEETKK